jgi:hypothetical protein
MSWKLNLFLPSGEGGGGGIENVLILPNLCLVLSIHMLFLRYLMAIYKMARL